MEKAKFFTYCSCPLHPFQILQRVNTDTSTKKHLYCNQCLIEEEVPIGQSHLVTLEEFLHAAASLYAEAKEKARSVPDPPLEYLDVVLKKAENLEKLTKHINHQKEQIEQAFMYVYKSLIETLDQKKKHCLGVLEEELAKVCQQYSLFEDQLHRAYPKKDEIDLLFPSRQELEKKVASILDASQLNRVIEDIKNDIYQDQDDKKEIYQSIRSTAKSLSKIDTVRPKFKISDLGLQSLESTLKQSMSRFSIDMDLKESFQPQAFSPRDVPESTMLNGEDFAVIQNWLPAKYQFSPKLIYRGSRDGMKGQVFHAKCDGKGPTVTVIKCRFTGSSKLCVIGGFLDQSWHSKGDWISSEEAFVFSLSSKTKCTILEKPHAAFGGGVWGINFGAEALCISNDLTRSYCFGGSLRYKNCNTIIDTDKAAGLENTNFAVKEIEVYLLR